MRFDISLLPAQAEFIQDTTTPNLLLCGGFGSGKSRAGALKAVILALANPGCDGIIASPTMGLAKRSIVKQVQEVLAELQIKHTFNKTELIFKIDCGNGRFSEIHVLSAENWVRLVGMNAAFFVFDEVDTMRPTPRARLGSSSPAASAQAASARCAPQRRPKASSSVTTSSSASPPRSQNSERAGG